ncbi:ferredoxin [Candidatus Woesearchaeota archaeon]|nr:ferredoxin [Candidatus Woesearchaeota archaeon]
MATETKKYKVVYDRENCIGAGACVLAYAERFAMNSKDDKADLLGGVKKGSNFELEFTLRELEEFKSAAQVCPVAVIKIFDVETGKEIL